MSANPSQLFLLSDHIKLSLLERQRAQSLNLPANTQDASITRSLSTFQDGLEALETEVQATPDSTLQSQLAQLRKQYDELSSQFKGDSDSKTSNTVTQPNDPALSPDFAAAQSPPATKKRHNQNTPYRDEPDGQSAENEAARNALFSGANGSAPYQDEPASAAEDPSLEGLSNEQLHLQHSGIIAEQDEQLDRLGLSIGRQRELSMRIGDELDEQVAMLEDVEDGVDRHQGRLDGARDRLGRFARKASSTDWSWWVIGGLILVLVLLIVILKGPKKR